MLNLNYLKQKELTPQLAARIVLERRACRNHLAPFIRGVFRIVSPADAYKHNWHIDLIAEHLEAVYNQEILRLIINIPPRYLKSISATVAFPAWVLGQNPSKRIMAASYSHFLSFKHSIDCRLVMESDWYKSIFPETVLRYGQIEKRKFETISKGHRIATSVGRGGTTVGEGGDILLVDDPVNPEQAYSEPERNTANRWYDQTYSTRLNDKKKGAIVIIMQRLHQNDLAGHVQKRDEWTVLKIPGEFKKRTIFDLKVVDDLGQVKKTKKILKKDSLLHPKYEGQVEIERSKKTLGSYGYSAQYQQNPSPEGGGIIKLAWFKRYKVLPPLQDVVQITQFWDTAQKSNEVLNAPWVCGTWYSTYDHHYLVHIFRDWMDYPAGKRTVKILAAKWTPHQIIIEDKSTGQSLIQELTRLPVLPFEPVQDKITRLSTESGLVESGVIYLPEEAPWLFDFEEEIQLFPNSTFKDQADMLSMALKFFRTQFLSNQINIGAGQSSVPQ